MILFLRSSFRAINWKHCFLRPQLAGGAVFGGGESINPIDMNISLFNLHLLSFSAHINQKRCAFSSSVFQLDVQNATELNDANVWIWHNQLVRINNFARVYKKKRIEKWHIFFSLRWNCSSLLLSLKLEGSGRRKCMFQTAN